MTASPENSNLFKIEQKYRALTNFDFFLRQNIATKYLLQLHTAE